jgi:hypothetical protein
VGERVDFVAVSKTMAGAGAVQETSPSDMLGCQRCTLYHFLARESTKGLAKSNIYNCKFVVLLISNIFPFQTVMSLRHEQIDIKDGQIEI